MEGDPDYGEGNHHLFEGILDFTGATTLCLMGFQVLVPTSFPVYNKIVEVFGGHSNLALPANQVEYFSKFQLWFAVAVALLSGTGQFFWWNKIDKQKLKKEFLTSSLITLVVFRDHHVIGRCQRSTVATPDRCRYIHYRLECRKCWRACGVQIPGFPAGRSRTSGSEWS